MTSQALATPSTSHEDVAFADFDLNALLSVADHLSELETEAHPEKAIPLSHRLLDASNDLCKFVHHDSCIRQSGFVELIKGVNKTVSETNSNNREYRACLKDFKDALTDHLVDLYDAPPADFTISQHP